MRPQKKLADVSVRCELLPFLRVNCCVTLDQLRHHTTSCFQLHEQQSDVRQQKILHSRSEHFVWIDGFVPIEKLSSQLTNKTTSCALRLSMYHASSSSEHSFKKNVSCTADQAHLRSLSGPGAVSIKARVLH